MNCFVRESRRGNHDAYQKRVFVWFSSPTLHLILHRTMESQDPKMAWVGWDPKVHLALNPLPWAGSPFIRPGSQSPIQPGLEEHPGMRHLQLLLATSSSILPSP